MRSKIIFPALALCLLFLTGQAVGGSGLKVGTAGAQELRLPVGSYSTSLGGAMIANVQGAEALYWNPAGVAQMEGSQAMFSRMEYIADINLSYFGICTNLGDFGSLGLSAKVLDIGDIPVTTEESPEGTGENFSPSFTVLGLTYSRQMTDRVSFGATMMYLSESIMRERAHGLAFDFGFQYIPGWRGLKLGFVMKNYGPAMRFDGPDFEYQLIPTEDDPQAANKTMRTQSAEFELPSSIQFGTSYELLDQGDNRATLVGNFQNNNFSQDEYRGGIEYSYREMLFLRGGYKGSTQNDYLFGPSFGFGLKFNLGQTKVDFDYSYLSTEYFDDNQVFTVKLSF